MKYEQGERDLVMLQHKFIVEWQDGSRYAAGFVCPIKASADMYTRIRKPLRRRWRLMAGPVGHSAMALTVGLPCGIATQLVLDGVLSAPGIQRPYTTEICDPFVRS